MDELASQIGMDPLEIRKINYLKKGESLPCGEVMENHVALEEITEKASGALGTKTKARGQLKIGQGVASGFQSYGRVIFVHDTSRSYVSVEMDGSITIRAGVQDIGGGQASSLCQIVAEVFGVPLEMVKIYIADTALTPLAGTTTATRQLYMSGNATLMAANEIRRTILKKAGQMLKTDPGRLDLVDQEVMDIEGSGRNLPFSDVVKACASDGLPLHNVALFKAPFGNVTEFERVEGKVFPDYTFGAHAAEVAVDEETGTVQVLKLVSCYDVGKAINPLSVEGQLEGGAIYGMGYGLMEEVILEEGITKTPSLSEYLLPTALDVPDVQTILVESGEGVGPFGAKGVGEPAVVSVAPAICSAIFNAVGVRIFDLPMTPEKIVNAIKAKKPG
jgi:CO/xanthine dehydrogenase Mo-binding subunit